MDGTAKWCIGGFVAVLGLVGLFLAAGAADRGIYVFGLAVAAFAVVFVCGLIKHSFDALEGAVRARRLPSAAE
jgi:hypothetical protein